MAKIVFNTGKEDILGQINFIVSEKEPSKNFSMTFYYKRPSIEIFSDLYKETLKSQCIFPVIFQFSDENGTKREEVMLMVDRKLKTALLFSENEKGDVESVLSKFFKDDIINFSYELAEKILERQVEMTKKKYLDLLKEEIESAIPKIQSFMAIRFVGKEIEKNVNYSEFISFLLKAEKEISERKFVLLPLVLEENKDFFMEVAWNLMNRASAMYHYLKFEDIVACYLSNENIRHLHIVARTCFENDPAFFYERKDEDFKEQNIERFYLTKEDIKFLISHFRSIIEAKQVEVQETLNLAEKENEFLKNVLSERVQEKNVLSKKRPLSFSLGA